MRLAHHPLVDQRVAGAVSKATGSPRSGTKVMLEMPPILTKTTGNRRA